MSDGQPRRLVLWGVGTSRTLRAHWALHELGLDYECRPILPRTGETQTQEYTELNPRQKIPLLQDGDFKIAESPAIAAYLSNTYGTRENALVPTEPWEQATWLEWCFYAATELDATSLYVMRRHGALKQIYGESQVAMESAAAYFATQLRHAEQALQDGRAFLVGGRLTDLPGLGGKLPGTGHRSVPRLSGADHVAPSLPRRLGGQYSEEHGVVASARRLIFRGAAGTRKIGVERQMPRAFGSGPGRTWTCFGMSGTPHSEHTITGSKSLPQRS